MSANVRFRHSAPKARRLASVAANAETVTPPARKRRRAGTLDCSSQPPFPAQPQPQSFSALLSPELPGRFGMFFAIASPYLQCGIESITPLRRLMQNPSQYRKPAENWQITGINLV